MPCVGGWIGGGVMGVRNTVINHVSAVRLNLALVTSWNMHTYGTQAVRRMINPCPLIDVYG